MTRHGRLGEALLVVSDTYGSGPTRFGVLGEAKLQTATSTRHGRLAEVSLIASTGGVFVNPISDVKIDALTAATVTASLTGGGTPDSWSFIQAGGPTVTLSAPSANSRTFLTPPTVEGTSVLIQVTATLNGVESDPILARFLVYPQQRWKLLDTGWVAHKPTRIP